MISNGRSHRLHGVIERVQSRINDCPAESLEPCDVKRDVVVHNKNRTGAVVACVTDVGQHTVERIRVEIAPTHFDNRAETAVESATSRGLDYIHLSSQHGV